MTAIKLKTFNSWPLPGVQYVTSVASLAPSGSPITVLYQARGGRCINGSGANQRLIVLTKILRLLPKVASPQSCWL